MTTNKPEVMAWYTPATRYTLPVVALDDRSQRGEPLIRLSDYEALQDKCEHYKAALLEMTVRSVSDQWRRSATDKELDRYLSAGIAQTEEERDRYKAECEKLRSIISDLQAAEQDHLLDYSAALKRMDLPSLVLGAWRYWMYRTTISSYAFLKYELPAAWPHLPENVRTVIVRDIQSDLDIAPEHCPVPAENIPLLEAILMMASMPKTYQR